MPIDTLHIICWPYCVKITSVLKAHQLSDDRWSFHVTANWRMTFAVNDEANEITILDLEDYH
jgi:plasmid maintenance system killer protein